MNRRKKALWFIFLLAISVVLLDTLGQLLRLYWSVWWFDVIMHFLGGVLVAFTAYSLSLSSHFSKFFRSGVVWKIMLFTLAVGVVWEIWEVANGWTASTEPHSVDTTLDLVMDILGASYGIKLFRKITKGDGR